MTRISEESERPASGGPSGEEGKTGDAGARRGPAPRVLVVDMDRALLGLLEEWLAGHGCVVTVDGGNGKPDGRAFDLVLVDVPFPRHGSDLLRRLAAAHPGTPILALSCSFFAGVVRDGAVARALGVAGVLPKPLDRASLIAAVETQLHRNR